MPLTITELLPDGRVFDEVRARVQQDDDGREWVDAEWFAVDTSSAIGLRRLHLRTDYLSAADWQVTARTLFPKRKANVVTLPDGRTATVPTLSRDERRRVLLASTASDVKAAVRAWYAARDRARTPFAYVEVQEDDA